VEEAYHSPLEGA